MTLKEHDFSARHLRKKNMVVEELNVGTLYIVQRLLPAALFTFDEAQDPMHFFKNWVPLGNRGNFDIQPVSRFKHRLNLREGSILMALENILIDDAMVGITTPNGIIHKFLYQGDFAYGNMSEAYRTGKLKDASTRQAEMDALTACAKFVSRMCEV